MRKFHSSTPWERFVWGMIAILFVFSFWYVLAIRSNSSLFPDPLTVLKRLANSFVEPIGTMTIQMHVLYSLSRVIVGVLLGFVCGVSLGLLMGLNADVAAFVTPLFNIIRPIPTVAWIPLSIIWFGLGETTKYFLIFISAFTGCTIQSFSGVKSVDKTLIGAARMLGASERRIFRTIIVPSCVPDICLGLQGALSTGWTTVVAAEMVRSSEGVGWLIVTGQNNLDMTQILVGIVAIGCIGAVLAAIATVIENKLGRWNNRSGV